LSFDPIAIANTLWKHWENGQPLQELPSDIRPLTRAQGYDAQGCLLVAAHMHQAGWKIAATSAMGQKHINVSGPLAGRILSGQVLPADARVPAAGNRMRVAEPEMAFMMGRDLPARHEDYTQAEVMAAVAELHPSIEIPNSRFARFTEAGEAQLLADNACAHQFILGPAAPASWRTLDLSQHPVRGQVTGTDGRRWERMGSGAAVLGDPRTALTWLVNELRALGLGLNAGQFVTTGTCMAPLEMNEGDAILADFGPLGQVGMRFGD
jgi:2-keto-4-pentenoate hydratase